MDQFKLVLWSLFFTLLVPLLVWTGLFSIFGWKLLIVFFLAAGLIFLLQDKILKSSYFQGIVQMLIPFALTFRFYDALRAGSAKSQDEGSIFQVLWATSRGFLKGEDATDEEDANKEAPSPKVQAKKAALREAEEAFDAPEAPLPPKAAKPAPPPPKPADLDDELAKLKQKMAREKEAKKVKEAVPEPSDL